MYCIRSLENLRSVRLQRTWKEISISARRFLLPRATETRNSLDADDQMKWPRRRLAMPHQSSGTATSPLAPQIIHRAVPASPSALNDRSSQGVTWYGTSETNTASAPV